MTNVHYTTKQGKWVHYPGNTKEEQPSGNDLSEESKENNKEVFSIL